MWDRVFSKPVYALSQLHDEVAWRLQEEIRQDTWKKALCSYIGHFMRWPFKGCTSGIYLFAYDLAWNVLIYTGFAGLRKGGILSVPLPLSMSKDRRAHAPAFSLFFALTIISKDEEVDAVFMNRL